MFKVKKKDAIKKDAQEERKAIQEVESAVAIGMYPHSNASGAAVSKKTLDNSTADQAKEQVKDIKFWGDGDTFKLISKASSAAEGWMKSTKAMNIESVGVLVQVTTQQGPHIAEALQFVPNTKLIEGVNPEGEVKERKVVIKDSLVSNCNTEKLTFREV